MLNLNDKFNWSIMALAQQSEVQFSLLPPGSYVGEEIILEYDEAVGEDLKNLNLNNFSLAQVNAIKELDQYILDHSGKNFEHLWLNNDNLNSEEWEKIRILAKNIILLMNWKLSVPKKLYDQVLYLSK